MKIGYLCGSRSRQRRAPEYNIRLIPCGNRRANNIKWRNEVPFAWIRKVVILICVCERLKGIHVLRAWILYIINAGKIVNLRGWNCQRRCADCVLKNSTPDESKLLVFIKVYSAAVYSSFVCVKIVNLGKYSSWIFFCSECSAALFCYRADAWCIISSWIHLCVGACSAVAVIINFEHHRSAFCVCQCYRGGFIWLICKCPSCSGGSIGNWCMSMLPIIKHFRNTEKASFWIFCFEFNCRELTPILISLKNMALHHCPYILRYVSGCWYQLLDKFSYWRINPFIVIDIFVKLRSVAYSIKEKLFKFFKIFVLRAVTINGLTNKIVKIYNTSKEVKHFFRNCAIHALFYRIEIISYSVFGTKVFCFICWCCDLHHVIWINILWRL